MLAAARAETGLAVVTEVMSREDVQLVARYADVLQIGARNMQNYRLLEAVGETRASRCCSSAAQRHASKNCCWPPNTSSTPAIPTSCSASGASARSRPTPASRCRWPRSRICTTKRTCRWSSIRATAPATRIWSPQMAAAAVAAGADGLIIEVHPDPEDALSDGYQSLTFKQFEETMELCRKVAEAVGRMM